MEFMIVWTVDLKHYLFFPAMSTFNWLLQKHHSNCPSQESAAAPTANIPLWWLEIHLWESTQHETKSSNPGARWHIYTRPELTVLSFSATSLFSQNQLKIRGLITRTKKSFSCLKGMSKMIIWYVFLRFRIWQWKRSSSFEMIILF